MQCFVRRLVMLNRLYKMALSELRLVPVLQVNWKWLKCKAGSLKKVLNDDRQQII